MSQVIEHQPWVGEASQSEGRVDTAIVGHSHHCAPGEDTPSFTTDIVNSLMAGRWSHPYFTRLKTYFEYSRHDEFWPKVMFFNYLPNCVTDRYEDGTPEQLILARRRFLGLLNEHRPRRLLVFSYKGWVQLPEFDGGLGFSPRLRVDGQTGLEYGTYLCGAETTLAFRLQHPQGATTATQIDQVRAASRFDALSA